MATKQEAIKRINYVPDGEHLAIAIWCRDDVKEVAQKLGKQLSDEQLDEILDEIDRRQDCTIGINWDVLQVYVQDYEAT
jgi:hypothetical protein